jgi:hypothetical protein
MIALVTEITRSHVRLQLADKTITIEGEGFARGYGSPDYVVYENSIQRWDPPFEGLLIDDKTKAEILVELKTEMSRRGMVIEVE